MSGETTLRDRAELLEDLTQIVQSMRNLASAELQRVAKGRIAREKARLAVEKALRSIGLASQAGPNAQNTNSICIVIGAERGFCGGFNGRIVQACIDHLEANPMAAIWPASHRLTDLLSSHKAALEMLPIAGCASSEEAEAVLSQWLSQLSEPIRIGQPIDVLHMEDELVKSDRLWPMPSRDDGPILPSDPTPVSPPAPRCWLPINGMRETLSRQWLALRLRELLLSSLEQENHWRLAQMQRAQDRLDELRRDLRRRWALVRQSNITTELETLMSSSPE